MTYNFDKVVDRSGTNDVKHEELQTMFGRKDLIPLWVADMDWETPPFITEALQRRCEHSLFGYTVEPEDYWPSVIDWIRERHGWEVNREWLTYIPGIVKGIGMVVNVFCQPEDAVIIMPPVYHPFRLTPEGNGRKVLYNPLIECEDGSYRMDFDNLVQVIEGYKEGRARVLILSNPHNPAGICWDAESLKRLAHICHEHQVLVISDEIHCDMALFGNRHIPFASVSDEARENSITFSAPSKTFNIAGIVSSWAVVPNDEIREKFYGWLEANEFNAPTLFAPIATIAALREGEEWREQMIKYVEGNVDMVIEFCREHIPAIRPLRPQASYLVWLDCRALGLSHEALLDLFVNQAHLALNDGEMFGVGTIPNCGQGFMRLNVGTQRATLLQALKQLEAAVLKLK